MPNPPSDLARGCGVSAGAFIVALVAVVTIVMLGFFFRVGYEWAGMVLGA